ncbi:MAG: AI-2E family transporter [Bacteroidota bacterium]|nr:AI-2E family transporter [Bacteroidota bacterium]
MTKNLRYFLLFLGAVLTIGFLWYFKSIVIYILISGVLSIIGRPLVDLFNKIHIKNIKLPKALSALITVLALWGIIFIFFRIFIPLIANQANEFSNIDAQTVVTKLDKPIQKAENFAEKYNILIDSNESFENYISQKFISLVNISELSGFFGSFAGVLGNIFITIFAISFITFFFLKDETLFYNGILILIPDKFLEKTKHILASIKKLLTRYFIGIIIQISSIITLVSIGLIIVGLDFSDALVIGLFVGIMNVIPYIGPIIGAILGVILGVATNLDMAFYAELLPLIMYMLLVFGLVQVVDVLLFQPVIFSNSVKAHPLEIFLVILMAGGLAGIPGMVLAIPTYTILRIIAKEFFFNFKIVKKLTEKI